MERIFQLHLGRPLTVEVMQNILTKQTDLAFSPDITEILNRDSLQREEGITPIELQAFAIGLGSETPPELTPVMLLLLANFFTKNPITGYPQIVSRILEFYQFEVFPQVFSEGLYASPTAHLLLPVFGAGKVYYQGYLLKAADVHDIFSWQPIPWPDKLPRALTAASFLGVSNLIYSFIQFKKIIQFSQLLSARTIEKPDSEHFFSDQINHLETQLNSYLAHPEMQVKHLNGLVYQLIKLFTTFGEHVFENLSRQTAEFDFSYVLNNLIYVNIGHLHALLEVLSRENLFLFEGNFDTHAGPSTSFTNRLMLQPYLFLKNLEKIGAIFTLIQFTSASNSENELYETANLRATYRKQVIDVLQQANFDELIRKTIAFMYARVSSK